MCQNRKFLIPLTVLALLLACCSAARPLCRSEASIRASLLKRTPLGSTYKHVQTFRKNQQWPGTSYKLPSDLRTSAGQPQIDPAHTWITAHLGTERLSFPPFATDVFAYWEFDTNNLLIQIWVDKETDAL